MLFKSVRNLVLFICLQLVSWESSSSYIIQYTENDLEVDTKAAPFRLIDFDTLSEAKERLRVIHEKYAPEMKPSVDEINYGKQEDLIKELKNRNSALQNTNDFLKKTVEQLTNNLELSINNIFNELITLKTEKLQKENSTNAANIEALNYQIIELTPETDSDLNEVTKCKEKLAEIAKSLAEKDEVIESLESQAKDQQKIETQLKEYKNELRLVELSASCIPFGEDPGVHKIKLPGIESFEVLCDSETAGPGWTVIQQRIDGWEDFFRDWDTYSNGFGTMDSDFFLGLEKIHQLTSSQRYELYIHMESFDGGINYARYDDFKVGSEDDGYELTSLGVFSGSESLDDMLRWHEKQKFTTFDRENDDWADGNCALDAHGGWWYKACAESNLNGKYSDVERTGGQTVYWAHYVALKKVKMLIRPKDLYFMN